MGATGRIVALCMGATDNIHAWVPRTWVPRMGAMGATYTLPHLLICLPMGSTWVPDTAFVILRPTPRRPLHCWRDITESQPPHPAHFWHLWQLHRCSCVIVNLIPWIAAKVPGTG